MSKSKVQSDLPTVSIKGKDYVLVNDRVKYLRENFPGYRMLSEMIYPYETHDGYVPDLEEANICIFRVTIFDAEGEAVANGHAFERRDEGFINKTSHIENAETSAWGRALANMGIGVDASVASADEVVLAIKGQDPVPADQPNTSDNQGKKKPKKKQPQKKKEAKEQPEKKKQKKEKEEKEKKEPEQTESKSPPEMDDKEVGKPLTKETQKQIVSAFEDVGLEQEDLENSCGRLVEDWDTVCRKHLLQLFQGIQDGDVSVDDVKALRGDDDE